MTVLSTANTHHPREELKSIGFSLTEYQKPQHGTPAGDRILGMYASLLSFGVPALKAWEQIHDLSKSSYHRTALSSVIDSVSGGSKVGEAIEMERKLFGDLAIVFLKLGEEGATFEGSLKRYLQVRRQIEINDQEAPPYMTTRTTREFSLVAGTLLDLGHEIREALKCAALEQPRRFRAAVDKTIARLEDGDDLGIALVPKVRFSPFQFGFDPLFIRTVQIAGENGHLSKALLEFGSKSWSLGKI